MSGGTFNLDTLMIRLGYKEEITLSRDEFMYLSEGKHLPETNAVEDV